MTAPCRPGGTEPCELQSCEGGAACAYRDAMALQERGFVSAKRYRSMPPRVVRVAPPWTLARYWALTRSEQGEWMALFRERYKGAPTP